MRESRAKRLALAAKELNVGISTIVEHLQKNGFEVDSKPTTRISEEMYDLLLKDFQKDKGIKEKADQINLGIKKRENIQIESSEPLIPRKKVDTEEILVQSESSVSTPPVEEQKVSEPAVEEPVAEKPEPPATPESAPESAPEKVDKLTVVGKIDLDSVGKKKTQPAKPETPKEEIPEEKETPEEVTPEVVAEEEPESQIHTTEKVQLEGPKIVGKIKLPTQHVRKKKEVSEQDADGKKKRRKRIVKTTGRVDQGSSSKDSSPAQRGKKDVRKRKRVHEPEVSEKEIQEQIKTTLAKLSGATRGKSTRSKLRRAKREESAIKDANENQEEDNIIAVTEFISVAELASLMDISSTDVISTCMTLGIIVSINQRIDAEVIELVAEEFGYKVKFIEVGADEMEEDGEEEDRPEDLESRTPIVTIMGHVDHGKTSLLDHIREANVVAGEKGGITQHIGAYDVELEDGRRIAFLDTPGHEAFTAMRARGAKVTDLAVIVIAADDQVMPQTREAISHAQAASVPMIFAFNKMDKPGANPEKIKEQLSQMNILVEDWGGKFQCQEISAKTGAGIPDLLEKILLEAELLDLKANPNKNAVGTIIEASLDKGRGYMTTLMVQEGELNAGDMMLAGPYYGKVKAMFNHRGKKIKSAGPSTPVLVLGFNGAPQAGEKLKVLDSEQDAKNVANKRSQIIREQGIRTKKHITLDEIGRRLAVGSFKELNVIIRGDVDGSVEALSDSLLKLSTGEIQVNIVHKGVGQITESDVLLASASDALIIGFQVRPSLSARKLAEKENIEIRLYSIIYNAIEEIKLAMEGMLDARIEEKIVANIEIREVFKISRVGTIAGCIVLDGKLGRNTKVRIIRDGIVVYSGELASLKRYKDDVKEVYSGQECGLNIKDFNDIKVGDIIEGYEQIEVKRSLG